MIDCPSIINIDRLIDISCHRLLSIAIDYRFHRLFWSCLRILMRLLQISINMAFSAFKLKFKNLILVNGIWVGREFAHFFKP